MLGAPVGSPAFLLSSLDLDAGEAPVAFARTVIRGDQFRFSLSLQSEQAVGAARMPSLLTYLS